MKKIILGLFIIVVLIIVGYWVFFRGNTEERNQDQISGLINENANDGTVTYRSEEYGFNVQIPVEFSIENQALPSDGKMLSQVLLWRKNQNTSQDARRDTPNGFNTSADDRAYLTIYSNINQLVAESAPQDFLTWHDDISSSQVITEKQTMTLGENTTIFTHEINGLEGATGQYLYFFNDDYIFVLESNDVPRDELLNIGKAFKF